MPPLIDGPGPLAAYALAVAGQRLDPVAGHLVALIGDGTQVARMAAVALPDGIDDMDGWVIRSLPGLDEAVRGVADAGDTPVVFLVAFADPPRIDFVETLSALTLIADALDHQQPGDDIVHEALIVDSAARTWASILTGDDPAPIPDLPDDLPPARDLSTVPTVDDDDPTLAPRILAQETQA